MEAIKATKRHCAYCFEVLLARLDGKESPPFPNTLQNSKLPLFVTWKKDDDLRGCIGTFSPDDLNKNLGKYALIAAMNDSRFSPIKKNELTELAVAVSLLVNFQKGKKCYDWEVGKHGIIIEIGDDYEATFLP